MEARSLFWASRVAESQLEKRGCVGNITGSEKDCGRNNSKDRRLSTVSANTLRMAAQKFRLRELELLNGDEDLGLAV